MTRDEAVKVGIKVLTILQNLGEELTGESKDCECNGCAEDKKAIIKYSKKIEKLIERYRKKKYGESKHLCGG
jgi:hypothetical protein